MRTTLYLDDDLLKKAKIKANEEGVSFTVFTENAIRESLARRDNKDQEPLKTLKTFKGTGTLPGVDLNNSASLLEMMES